jgi:ADP-ribose pyrophosphatase YjhB (NUDIX family)
MSGVSHYERSLPRRLRPDGGARDGADAMATSIDDIRRSLGARAPTVHTLGPEPPRVRAAVAVIARGGVGDAELLFIRRSHKDDDPWSGDIAFPGGRIDGVDEHPRAAAERETLEEVGIDLGATECLGRLDDVAGGAGQVVVSGFVYSLTAPVELRPNHEVASASTATKVAT